jgi:hypothetical protein
VSFPNLYLCLFKVCASKHAACLTFALPCLADERRRIALHDYDPPGMVNSGLGSMDDEASDDPKAVGSGSGGNAASPPRGARAQELEKAAALGLVVDADALQHNVAASPMASVMGVDCDEDDDDDEVLLDASSPISVLTEGSLRRRRESLDGNRAGGNGGSFAPARVVTARRRWADEDSSDDDDDLL